MPYTGIDVVVPVHDEELLLPDCLDALEACIAVTALPVTVTVVLDACTDESEDIALGRARLVRVDERNVGAARAAGFDFALAHAPGSSTPGTSAAPTTGPRWLATTDADSRVPLTWLTDQLTLARAGADMVVGLVDVDDWSDWDPATRAQFLDLYCSTAGHRHVHGANLGLNSRAYELLGGFDPVPTDEDVRLVQRAQSAGLTVAWAGSTPVTTSARRTSRAPSGFAGYLAATEREVAG